jgi:hypothetical protein
MPRHPAEFTDTDSRVMEVWLGLLREKTPDERIAIAFDLTDLALRMAESGVRANHPQASERVIFLRCASLRIPRDLMIRAYGWHLELTSGEFPASDAAHTRWSAGAADRSA